MTDDRSLERAARSFIEPGPTRAPEAAVERALDAIQTTRQERDLRILRRFSTMTMTTRLAAAAVVGVIAIGGAAFLLRPTTPDVGSKPPAAAATPSSPNSSPSDGAAQLQAYRDARDAVCASLASIPDLGPSPAPSAVVGFLQATIARGTEEASKLAAIQAPPSLAAEHLANIQTLRDVLALLNHEIELIQANRMSEAATVDQATGSLSTLFEQFESKYGLRPCP